VTGLHVGVTGLQDLGLSESPVRDRGRSITASEQLRNLSPADFPGMLLLMRFFGQVAFTAVAGLCHHGHSSAEMVVRAHRDAAGIAL
jgi:hypothetical protein